MAGVPLMVGGAGVATEVTWMENAGSEAVAVPFVTEMTMFEYVPTAPSCGVPDNMPVEVLKLAHAGRLVTEKVSVLPGASTRPGVNAYAEPATTWVAGVPVMASARVSACVGGVLLFEATAAVSPDTVVAAPPPQPASAVNTTPRAQISFRIFTGWSF